MSPVESVCRAVNSRQLQQYGGVIVVALDGRSGVGKSTLASTIARDLGAAVVHSLPQMASIATSIGSDSVARHSIR